MNTHASNVFTLRPRSGERGKQVEGVEKVDGGDYGGGCVGPVRARGEGGAVPHKQNYSSWKILQVN